MKIKCTNCLRKHLSLCKSYMKEVLDGHGQGGNPDHRDDIQGQLSNAQYHAALIDDVFCRKVRYIRRNLQSRRMIPELQDMEVISLLYHYSDKFDGLEPDDAVIKSYMNLPETQTVSDVFSSNMKSGCGCSKNG